MRNRQLALTGPFAAALLGLDGFRDIPFRPVWCSPANGVGDIRTRLWGEPVWIEDLPVAPTSLVLRHLHLTPPSLADGIGVTDRIEYGVEHALRDLMVSLTDLRIRGGSCPGAALLRYVLARRGLEPPTESFAETEAVQLFRSWGFQPWRQVLVVENGRVVHRVDFAFPFRKIRRPAVVGPDDALLVELDGRKFHEQQFERDHQRQMTYDALGYSSLSFTPAQMRQSPKRLRSAIEAKMRAHRTTSRISPHNLASLGSGPTRIERVVR